MKKNKIKILVVLTVVCTSLFSCDEYLDLKPENIITKQDFWQTEEQVSSALAGCYASMSQPGVTDRVLKWGELRAEMLINNASSGDDQDLMLNNVTPSNSLTNWSTFYTAINNCNLVLEYTDIAQELDVSFTKSEADNFKAQAISIRSLLYFILVKNFKELPLVLTATTNSEVDFLPKKSEESVIIEQIITDLEGAIDDLSLGYAQSPAHDKGRITKGAALAILADVYLWNEQYDDCISACKRIQDLNKYSLVPGESWFNDLFLLGNSQEGIFELQIGYESGSTYFNAFNYTLVPDFRPYNEIVELYNEDGGTSTDVRGLYSTYSGNEELAFVWKFAGADNVGLLVRASNFFQNNVIFYRYADVLLMQAEAYVLSSTDQQLSTAYELVNEVHVRATGIPLDQNLSSSAILDNILLERQKEFAFEGKRWYDLLRFAKRNDFERQEELIYPLANFKSGPNDFEVILSYFSDEESYYLPINTSELNLNSNLEQNPFYEN